MNNKIIIYKKNKIKEIINKIISKIIKRQKYDEDIVNDRNDECLNDRNNFKSQIAIKDDSEKIEKLIRQIKNNQINLNEISDEQLEKIETKLKEYLKKLKQTVLY